ncbi:MAG: GtrA family protein [Peptococcaceae bacterium]|nr:GtrA family protein [Peptococcaceae bacterium]
MIIRQFFRFSISSFAASLIDLGIFTLINMRLGSLLPVGNRLLTAVIAARVISALCNYTFNHKAVFQSKQAYGKTLVRYTTVAFLQMAVSYLVVYQLSLAFGKAAGWDTVYKAITDIALYFISFFIQRKWIFK